MLAIALTSTVSLSAEALRALCRVKAATDMGGWYALGVPEVELIKGLATQGLVYSDFGGQFTVLRTTKFGEAALAAHYPGVSDFIPLAAQA